MSRTDFDANGGCVETDYRRTVKIVSDAGYRGGITGSSIEGSKRSESDGIWATKRLLEKAWEEMS